jgi:hypothetical protein
MKTLLAVMALVAMASSANAEIMCTERGGCWETGKSIRLINSRQETSVPNRDGKGTMRIIGIANDIPNQRAAAPPARGR